MKKITTLCLLLVSGIFLRAQVAYDALTFSNPYPQASSELRFSFDKKMSPLKNEDKIDIVVYQFTEKGMKVKEPVLKKTGSVYTSSFVPDADATVLAFGISSGDVKDNNGGKGYYVPVYTAQKTPVKGYYTGAAQLYSGAGEYLFGTGTDAVKALNTMEDGVKTYPGLAEDPAFYGSYLGTISTAKKAEGKEIVLNKLAALEKKPSLSEQDYNILIGWYGRLKMKSKADSLTALMKKAYPAGGWVYNEMLNNFFREKDAAKKAAMYQQYMTVAPADKKDENTINTMKGQLARAYRAEKNDAMFTKWIADAAPSARAAVYNDLSWNMAEAGENLPEAKKMSEEATAWAKQEVTRPTDKKSDAFTSKQWNEQRTGTYGMYADTYAFILYNTGDYKKGLPYAKDGAASAKMKDPELNERYAMLLEKAAAPADAKRIIEEMVKSGKASSKTKDALKSLYVREKKSDSGFDQYLALLEEDAKMKRTAEIAKTMINKAAPAFVLRDWEGKEVSLESLKGKIVVVDFWATWCGPCIASMPGMKKAQEKLAAREDVKFLFIDTWENVDNKLDNAKDFMKQKNFPFYVLMDNENKMVTDFEVSGIPTKFILDKAGNIRFKAVGFEGSTDALADEVLAMVEMAGK